MKIIYVADIVVDPTSAQTVHVDEVCEQFARLGNEVHLFVPDSATRLGARSYQVTYLPVSKFGAAVAFQIKLLRLLWSEIRTNKPDVIYARHSLFLLAPLVLSRLGHVPLVLEVNGKLIKEAWLRTTNLRGRLFLYLRVFSLIERVNISGATKIICMTDGIKDYLTATYGVSPDTCAVVGSGVDLDQFTPQDATVARAAIGVNPAAFYVGYIGSFFSWQGLSYVVEAAKQLATTHPAIQFVLVGEGDDKNALQSFVAEHHLESTVHFVPSIGRALVPVYINSFDICLCTPTRFRAGTTSPFKVYEYLACGRPVIVSNIIGMQQEFANMVAYVEPESAIALAEGIVQLYENATRRAELGETGHRIVAEQHSWRAVAEQLLVHCRPTK